MASRVPNVFHFVFGLRPQTEPFHLMHYLCLASCIGVNKPDKVMFHCQHEPWGEYWERIRPQLTIMPIEPDPFISSFHYRDPDLDHLRYAHLADVARLEIIAEHGGVYADMDTLFVSPLPASFFERPFVMGREPAEWSAAATEAGGALCNAWMMGEPGAPFAREWLSQTYQSFDGSWSAHSTLLPFRMSREHPEWIHVEPSRSFFAFGFDQFGIRDIFKRRVRDLDGIYSIHLWGHCWWDAGIRHAGFFHAKRLTPAYVRHAGTTYATVARQFLPADFGRQDTAAWAGERFRAAAENGAWLAARAKRKLTKTVPRRDGSARRHKWFGAIVLRAPVPIRSLRNVPVLGGLIHYLSHLILPADERLRVQVQNGPGTGILLELNPRTGGPYRLGELEIAIQRALVEQLQPGMVFYDLGANVGFFSLLAARLVGPTGQVFSFEPDPEVAARLRRNIELNKFPNVTVIEAGAWSVSASVRFVPSDGSSPERGTGRFLADENQAVGTPTRCIALDDFVQSARRPDAIKCDVEGAELEVLRGAEGLFQTQRPWIICEVHSEANDRMTREFLGGRGYDTRSLDARHILAEPKTAR